MREWILLILGQRSKVKITIGKMLHNDKQKYFDVTWNSVSHEIGWDRLILRPSAKGQCHWKKTLCFVYFTFQFQQHIFFLSRVPTVLEKSLNFWFSLKSPWKWICPWKVLEFRAPSLKFQLEVLDFLLCVFWTESLNGYSTLRGTRANFSPKIRLASLAAAYKLNIFPVPLAHI